MQQLKKIGDSLAESLRKQQAEKQQQQKQEMDQSLKKSIENLDRKSVDEQKAAKSVDELRAKIERLNRQAEEEDKVQKMGSTRLPLENRSQSHEHWSPGGDCSALLDENQRTLEQLNNEAEQNGLNHAMDEAGLGAGSFTFENAKKEITDYAVEKAKAENLKLGLDEMKKAIEEAKKLDAFMKQLRACVDGKETRGCLIMMAIKQGTKRTKEWLLKQADAGTKSGYDRVKKFHKIYTGYVNKLHNAYSQQSRSATNCLGNGR